MLLATQFIHDPLMDSKFEKFLIREKQMGDKETN